MGQEIGPDLNRADAFDKATLVLCFLYFAAVSLATHVIGKPVIGFALLPLPLLFFRLTSVRFMVLSLSCWLLFFEAFQVGSNFLFFNTPDTLFAVFVIVRLFFRQEFLSFRLPTSGLLMAPVPFPGGRVDHDHSGLAATTAWTSTCSGTSETCSTFAWW